MKIPESFSQEEWDARQFGEDNTSDALTATEEEYQKPSFGPEHKIKESFSQEEWEARQNTPESYSSEEWDARNLQLSTEDKINQIEQQINDDFTVGIESRIESIKTGMPVADIEQALKLDRKEQKEKAYQALPPEEKLNIARKKYPEELVSPESVGAMTSTEDALMTPEQAGIKPSVPTYKELIGAQWKLGEINNKIGLFGNDARMKKISWEDALKGIEAIEKEKPDLQQIAQDENLGLLKKMVGGTINTLPYMGRTQIEGLKYGLPTAVVAGLAPLALRLPPSPQAAKAGYSAGSAFGMIKSASDIEGGNLYVKLRKQGMSHELARNVSIPVGIGIGIVEMSQVERVAEKIPGLKQLMTEGSKQVIESKAFKEIAKKFLKEYSKDIIVEIFQEDIQEFIGIIGEIIASAWDAKKKGEDYNGPTFTSSLDRIIQTTEQMALSAPLLVLPGNVAGIKVGENVPRGTIEPSKTAIIEPLENAQDYTYKGFTYKASRTLSGNKPWKVQKLDSEGNVLHELEPKSDAYMNKMKPVATQEAQETTISEKPSEGMAKEDISSLAQEQPTKDVEEKPVWTMTEQEFISDLNQNSPTGQNYDTKAVRKNYKETILKAVESGEDVPANVISQFPELEKKGTFAIPQEELAKLEGIKPVENKQVMEESIVPELQLEEPVLQQVAKEEAPAVQVKKPITLKQPKEFIKGSEEAETVKIPQSQLPVESKGAEKTPKLIQRIADRLKEMNEDAGITYNELNLKKDAESAYNLVENNKVKARKIAFGIESPSEGTTQSAVAEAYRMSVENNPKEYAKIARYEAMREFRMGQEISTLQTFREKLNPMPFIKKAISQRIVKTAEAMGIKDRGKQNKAVQEVLQKETAELKKDLSLKNIKIQNALQILQSITC